MRLTIDDLHARRCPSAAASAGARERASRSLAAAFSLIEIMVTIGLLSVIVTGLLMTFNQVQRAFRTSMTQTDLLENGRATMDMITREIEQLAPCYYSNLNFFAEPAPGFSPLVQSLPGNSQPRINAVQHFFFLTKFNQDVYGTGYEVLPDYLNAGVGTLYRYSAMNTPRSAPPNLAAAFVVTTNLNRVADGIVHLRIDAYDSRGLLISPNNLYPLRNMLRVWDPVVPGLVDYYFVSNAVPAYLDIELGLLEPQVLAKYRAIGGVNAAAQRQYLDKHVAQVHLFRQRVPIHNVDFTAYQ
jgi:hypothetical protein